MKPLYFLLLLSIPVCAGNRIAVMNRIDYTHTFFDGRDTIPGTEEKAKIRNSIFEINYLRLDFKGKIGDNTGYRFRLRFDKEVVQYPFVLGGSEFVSYAYVDQKVTDMLSFKFGRIWNYQGGWESDISSMDVYLYSNLERYLKLKTSGTFGGPVYANGINPTLTFRDQKLHLAVTNSGIGKKGGEFLNRYFQATLAYHGAFLEGWIQPLVSAALRPTEAMDTTQNGVLHLMLDGQQIYSVGLKVDPRPVGGEIDLAYFKNENGFHGRNPVTDSLGITTYIARSDSFPAMLSVSGTLRAHVKDFRFQLKGFHDRFYNIKKEAANVPQINGEEIRSALGFSPAVEYYPVAGKNFRYHLAYAYTLQTPVKSTLFNQTDPDPAKWFFESRQGSSVWHQKTFLGMAGDFTLFE